MTTLVALVQRAATITVPFNTQDAVLLIRALGALHLARPEVRTVAQKASFSIASSPTDVPTPVLIDVVHHLTAMQSTQLPVVQRVLLKRFCELPLTSSSSSSASLSYAASLKPPDPRTVQKAALTLAKMGRHASHAEATEHVLRLVHVALAQRPDDTGLHMVYACLYANSARYTAQPHWWRTPAEQRKLSMHTLERSLTYLLRHPEVYQQAAGNVARQLLHLLVLLPPPATTWSSGIKGPSFSFDDVRRWEAYVGTGVLAQRVSGGAYTQFVYSFAADLCRVDVHRFLAVVRPMTGWVGAAAAAVAADNGGDVHTDASRRLNVYEQTKLAGALTDVLQALASHPARPPTTAMSQSVIFEQKEMLVSACSAALASDAQRDWETALQLCCSLLQALVALELEGVSHVPSDAAHSLETIAHPDPFLVAALLNAFAVLTTDVLGGTSRGALDVTALLPDACVTAMTELVLLLSGAPPSLLSWTLRSLAALRRWVAADLVPALERGADVLLRQYCRSPATQRSIRAEAGVVYAYGRFTDDDERVGARTFLDAPGEDHANPQRGSGAAPSVPLADTAFPVLSTIDPVLRSLAPRLRGGGAGAHTVTMEDADMLLAGLLHLVAADTAPAVSPLLDDLIASLAAFLASNAGAAASRAELTSDDVVMRAARLQVLVARLAEPHVLRPATTAALTTAADGAVGEVSAWVATAVSDDASRVGSATMLRVLRTLERRLPRRAHGLTSPALAMPSAAGCSSSCPLLLVVCAAYQRHVNDLTAQCAAAGARLSQVVHVLWRARQVGVQLVFTDDEGAGADRGDAMDAALWSGSVPLPRLCFPLRLCRATFLSGTAAADLLLLLAVSQLPISVPSAVTAAQRLPPHVVPQLRNELFDRLETTADVAGVVLLVQLNETLAVSQLVFPDKVGLHRLCRCIEETAGSLVLAVARDAAEDAARRNRRGGPLAAARRLLHSLLRSQLPARLSSIDEADQSRLLSAVQLLAQQLEDSTRRADVVAVMKARLLFSGVL